MPEKDQRVGEYVLDEKIGHGAYGEVWRAHHHIWSDQLAAVKIPTDPVYLSNLRADGIRVQRLAHPNIVRPIGFDPNADPPYLMAEYLHGGSLRPLIAQHRLSVADVVNILRQVLTGLQFGHERGVVHGDIKPDNVLLDDAAIGSGFSAPGSVKVTDFGIGLAATATATGDAGARSAAQRLGTLAYVAPEQRDGAAPDVRSDVYAVGVMLFELLTGERPSGAELPSELNPQVPRVLDEVFRRSYARRERRFASAREFLEVLPPEVVPAPTRAPSPPATAFPPAAPAPMEAPRSVSPPPPVIAPEQEKEIPIARDVAALDIAMRDMEDREFAARPSRFVTRVSPNPIKNDRGEAGPEIGLRDEDGAPPGDDAEELDAIDIVEENSPGVQSVSPAAPPDIEEPALLDEASIIDDEPDDARKNETAGPARSSLPGQTQTPPQGGGRLAIPPIPRLPSRADHGAVFDETAKKQIRAGDELRGIMRPFFESRELDEGETNNIRLRLLKWANSLVGSEADFDQHVVLMRAVAQPLNQVTLVTRIDGKDLVATRLLDNPGGRECEDALRNEDFRALAHISSERFGPRLFDSVGSPALRATVGDLIRDAAGQTTGAIQRQDLFIGRANVIVIDYQFEGTRQRAFMVGYSLNVVAPKNPFARIREETTKRAAALLDGEQIRLGIKELRRGLDSRWRDRVGNMLNALRGKLAAAYMAEARELLQNFAWLESLEVSGKAGQLVAGYDDALQHAAIVRKRVNLLQLTPGLLLAALFLFFSIMGATDSKLTPGVKAWLIRLVSNTFFASSLATAIATVWANKKLALRMARTDLAFYHAMLLPVLIGGILAFAPYRFLDWKGDIICGVLLAAVIVGDVLMFKYLRGSLIRPRSGQFLVGDEATLLLRIETMLDHDWDRLRPYYLALGPLYSFVGVKTDLPPGITADLTPVPAEAPTAPPPPKTSIPRLKPVEAPDTVVTSVASESTGDEDVDRLAGQVVNRINAGARALVPPGRMILTLLAEYTKSVNSRQLGMVQTNAQKIEQKGKDLADKLADFEQLCNSPLTLDASEASSALRELEQKMARKPQEPDFHVLRTVADWAKNFKADQSGAIHELTQLLPEAQAALDRLKKL